MGKSPDREPKHRAWSQLPLFPVTLFLAEWL